MRIILKFVLIPLIFIALPIWLAVPCAALVLYWIGSDIFGYRLFWERYTVHKTSLMKFIKFESRSKLKSYTRSRNPKYGECVAICNLENGRTVGASVIFSSETLRNNKKLIKDGVIKRDSYRRKQVYIPGRDEVKAVYSTTRNGYKMFHYNATHLVPFRLCLSEEGEVLFTGTAALNTGSRPSKHWLMKPEITQRRVSYILDKIKYRPKYFMKERPVPTWCDGSNAPEDNRLSLNDFECVIDSLVFSKDTPYHAMWQYSVECFYEDNSLIPTYVVAELYNITQHKLMFKARLENTL